MQKVTLSLAAIHVAAPIGGALAAETLTAADKSMAVTAITGVKTELDELNATSRDSRSSLATMTGHRLARPVANAAAS
jgi:hypothetical protein